MQIQDNYLPVIYCDVYIADISRLQRPHIGDAVADHLISHSSSWNNGHVRIFYLIDTGAAGLGELVVVERTAEEFTIDTCPAELWRIPGIALPVHSRFVYDPVNLIRGNPGPHRGRCLVQHLHITSSLKHTTLLCTGPACPACRLPAGPPTHSRLMP